MQLKLIEFTIRFPRNTPSVVVFILSVYLFPLKVFLFNCLFGKECKSFLIDLKKKIDSTANFTAEMSIIFWNYPLKKGKTSYCLQRAR